MRWLGQGKKSLLPDATADLKNLNNFVEFVAARPAMLAGECPQPRISLRFQRFSKADDRPKLTSIEPGFRLNNVYARLHHISVILAVRWPAGHVRRGWRRTIAGGQGNGSGGEGAVVRFKSPAAHSA